LKTDDNVKYGRGGVIEQKGRPKGFSYPFDQLTVFMEIFIFRVKAKYLNLPPQIHQFFLHQFSRTFLPFDKLLTTVVDRLGGGRGGQ
jgi:hypothetical protein